MNAQICFLPSASPPVKHSRLAAALCSSLLVLALSGFGDAAAATSTPLRIVSTPNPNVFPLLVAMAETPDLPITLLPVSNASAIDTAFTADNAEGLLSMTYVAAKEVTQGTVPDLQLYAATFWRGFSELTLTSESAASFQDLAGKNLLVSGPLGSGENSGPDILFQAALRRSGISTSSYTDTGNMRNFGIFDVFYVPMMQAVGDIINQTPLNNGASSQPPSAAFLAEPAATGLILKSLTAGIPLKRAIDIQTLFTGYPRFPYGQLPLGGISVRAAVANDPSRAATVQRFVTAYLAASAELANAQRNPIEIAKLSGIISAGITQYYGSMGVSVPRMVVAAALVNGQLIYRSDLTLTQIQPDLNGWIHELLGTAPPASFYHY